MDDHWKSFIVVSLNLILPKAPILGHSSVLNLPGPKIPDLQLKILFVITLNGRDLHWRFQQPRCVQGPTILTQPPNKSIKTTPTKIDQPQRMQHDGVPTTWINPRWHLLHFALFLFSHKLSFPPKLTVLRF